MSLLIGATLALAIGLFATWVGLDRDRAFYPTVMLVIASYYVLFAVMGGEARSLLTECLVLVPFLLASVGGFKTTPWLLVGALAAHGVMDVFHPHLVVNPGVPVWWPEFCLAYDVVAAGYLAASLGGRTNPRRGGAFPLASPGWQRRRTAASCSGRERACGSSAPLPVSDTQRPTATLITSSR